VPRLVRVDLSHASASGPRSYYEIKYADPTTRLIEHHRDRRVGT